MKIETESESRDQNGARDAKPSRTPTRALVVGDEEAMCALIKETLEAASIEAVTLTASAEAAAQFQKEKFDVILVDLCAPPVDATKLVHGIRLSGFNRKTPIIMISDDLRPSALSEGFKAGASLFVYKPVDRAHLKARANSSGRRGPIGGNEINAPEMRRGREKFDADALAFVGGFAEKDDAGFLLFLREGIGEDEHGVHGERLVQVHQAAVRIDHDGFAGLAEAAAVGILSRDHHAHPHEDPGTAANLVEIALGHGKSMLRHFDCAVNETVINVFPPCNAGLPSRIPRRAKAFPYA